MKNLQKFISKLLTEKTSGLEFLYDVPFENIYSFCLEDENVFYINDKFWRSLGYSESEFPKSAIEIRNLIEPSDVIVSRDNVLRNLNEPTKTFEQVLRYKTKNGRYNWVHNIGKVINDEENNRKLLIGIHSKISETKQTEKLLAMCNEAAKIGYWYLDLKQNQVFWSAQTKRIHEVPFDYEPTLETAINFYKEGEHRDKITAVVNEAIANDKAFNVELLIITQNGNEKWVNSVGKPLFVDNECVQLYGIFQDIDQKVKERLALVESEKNQREILQSITDIIFKVDNSGIISELSDRWDKQLGYNAEEVIGKKITDFVHRKDIVLLMDFLNHATYSGKESESIQIRVKNVQDQWIWYNVSVRLRITLTGTVCGYQGVLTNIHHLKKTEDELERTKQFLERTNKVAKVGGWEFDVIKQKAIWTENFAKIHDVPFDKIKSTADFLHLYNKESKDKIKLYFNKSLEKPGVHDFFLKCQTPIGKIKWMRCNAISEFENNVCVKLYGILQDVTEIQKLNDDLFQSLQQLDSILMEMTEVVWSVKLPEKTMIFVTPSIEKLYGIPHEACMKDSYHWTWVIHPEDKHLIQKIIDRVDKDGHYQQKYRIIDGQGQIKWVENRGTIIYENGVAVRAHGITTDCTQQMIAEQTIKYELGIQNLLLNISSAFIKCDLNFLDNVINEALKEVGQFINADRSYLFMADLKKKTITNTHEWCRDGVSPQIQNLVELPILAFKEQFEKHINNEPYIVESIEVLEDTALKNHFKTQEIKSLFTIPIINQNELMGFIGFDYVLREHKRNDNEMKLLFFFAHLLYNQFDRKRRMIQLTVKEERYRNIIANMHLGILEVNNDDEIVFANQSFLDMSGYSISEILNKNATEIYLGKEKIPITKSKIEKRKKGESDSYEIKVKNKKGEERWWLISGAPNYNDNGELVGSVGIHMDITDKKRLEKHLEYNASLFRALFENSPIGIALNDYETGAFLDVNKKLLAPSGYTKQEFLHLTMEDITPFEYWDADKNASGQLSQFGIYQNYQKKVLNKDGDVYPVEMRGTLVKTPDGQRKVWSFMEDISEKKHLENEVIRESNLRKRIADDLEEVREKNKEELYQDLHDGVNQLLFAAKLGIENAEIKDNKHLNYSLDCLTKAIEEIRKIAFESTSQFITEQHFDEALTEYLLRLNTYSEMKISMDNCILEPLDMDIRTKKHLFRICQELTQNAMKHSGASRMQFRLKIEDEHLIIIAKDNGKGLSSNSKKGVGVKGIHDRAYLIGGKIRYFNFPGKGLGFYMSVKIEGSNVLGTI